ncbi:hypothetical protein [Spirosoma lituiforme]
MAEGVEIYAIEAKEITPGIENPIHWRLLTTWPVENLQAVLLCVDWYSYRWMIEVVFRILKKEGFDIEANKFSRGKAVRKLCLLTMDRTTEADHYQTFHHADCLWISGRVTCFVLFLN